MALNPDSYISFIFALSIILIFIFVGIIQVYWLRSELFKKYRWPLDCGLKFRSRRIWGENKTVGGILILWPLTFISLILGLLLLNLINFSPVLNTNNSVILITDYLLIGFVISSGYICGELINSFIKRQLGIPAGQLIKNRNLQTFQIIFDQVDSVIFSLISFSMIVKINLTFTLIIITIGPLVHMLFNVLLHKIGLKAEAR
jgi:hypothetical protein